MPAAPSPDAVREAISALDPHAAHPAAGELFDPLYRYAEEGHPEHLAALQAALVRWADHPAARAVRAALAPWGAVPTRTLEQVLEADGPLVPGEDPVEEVARRLARGAQARAVMEERIAVLERDRRALSRTADAMAAVAALLAVAAILGWLAAIGGWEIPWSEPPAPEPPAPHP